MRAAAIFSSNMVLQREKPISVWGDARDGTLVSVRLADFSATATARDGVWRVQLPPMPAQEGLTMTVSSDDETHVFTNVSVGEVWLCGGQSNMEFELRNEKSGKALLASLTPKSGLRFYYTPKQRVKNDEFASIERNTCWNLATPETAGSWSAVGVYFALELHKRLGVTVGLIGCNWGGTSATAWISRDDIAAHNAIRSYLDDYDAAMAGKTEAQHIEEYNAYISYEGAWWQRCSAYYETHPDASWDEVTENCGESHYPPPMGPVCELRPAGLYDTMLSRVSPYTLRGFLYYQGESDDHKPRTYDILLQTLIARWRSDWHDDTLPFLVVQLPKYKPAADPDYCHWCLIREAQRKVCRTTKNTGLAVILDCGEFDNIHPKDKSQVGYRLALQAFYEVYGILDDAAANPPRYRDFYTDGSILTLRFDNAARGFRTDLSLNGFEIAGDDLEWHDAKAEIENDVITLQSDAVPHPLHARYAWRNYPDVTLYGANGLPVSPFCTDDI